MAISNLEEFDKAMETVRKHVEESSVGRIYLIEGKDRKPILLLHAKTQNENIEKLISQIDEYCGDRLDVILVQDYDFANITEKVVKDEDDETGNQKAANLEL